MAFERYIICVDDMDGDFCVTLDVAIAAAVYAFLHGAKTVSISKNARPQQRQSRRKKSPESEKHSKAK